MSCTRYSCAFLPQHVVVKDKTVYVLDLAAKLDSTAEYICKAQWGNIAFPPPFGREALQEVWVWCLNVDVLL